MQNRNTIQATMQQQIRTGVYLDQHRHSAIVVRVKEGRVTFLSLNQTKPERVQGRVSYQPVTQRVDVETYSAERFAEQYSLPLPQYPLLRALNHYWNSGLEVTEQAHHVIGVVLKNLQST